MEITVREQTAKDAELSLHLQNAAHKHEVTSLRAEIEASQPRPILERALAELEQRNKEMEELLRKKCTEIEENDDRSLE